MGFWSFYFFAKLLMFAGGFIGFHVWENLLFALFTALPLRRPLLRVFKQLVAVPVGVALLYHDSWLPPWQRLFAQWDQVSEFSLPYLLELSTRFLNPQLMLALAVLLAVYWLLSRKLRMSSFAVLGILMAPWIGVWSGAVVPTAPAPVATAAAAPGEVAFSASPAALNARLEAFYQREQQRRLRLPTPAAGEPPFDVLLLQICSLSWDDLDLIGQRDHPLMSRLDLRFDDFSAAASYSGPAAIRLLRGACGQRPHEALYQPVDPACQLVNQFSAVGYEPQWVMNHDGVFGNMLADIRDRGGMSAELFPLRGQPPVLRAFDGTDYYGDYALLSAWWQQRLAAPAERVLLYYNTGTLHDGNRFLDGRRFGVRESYRRRTEILFADLARFLDDIEASGRRAVVVLVPEHGANTRGDRMQISGLREIPSPGIGLIPVGVALAGLEARPVPAISEQPTSHFGLTTLLGRLLAESPFGPQAPPLEGYLRDLPETEYVAENDGVVVMQAGGRYWMRTADGRWSEYSGGRQ